MKFFVPQYKKYIRLVQCVQRKESKKVKSLEGRTYEEWLRSLGFFILEERRMRGDFIAVSKEGSGDW